MKKLGIIGGAGPLASALLYETLIQESYALGRQVPELILINYPFTRGLSLKEGKVNEEIIHQELNYCIQLLAQSDVELGFLACNTLHLFLKKLARPIPFYDLPELIIKTAKEKKHHRLLILGTENTCHSALYQFAEMEMIYPSQSDQALIERVIDRILEGKILEKDALLVSQVIERTSYLHSFDAIVLGCTDFPVLHHRFPISATQPIYDSIKIPAKILVGLL